jgi:hypothetical protein
MAKVATKKTSKRASKAAPRESDNFYFLKILIYFIVGTLWIKLNGIVVLPIGLLLGVLLAQHDKFVIDRKIEYAILLVAALLNLAVAGFFISFWT